MQNRDYGNILATTSITHPILAYFKWHLLLLKSMGLIPFYTTLNFCEITMPNRRWLLINRSILFVKFVLNLLYLHSILSPTILEIAFAEGNTDGINNAVDALFCFLSNFVISWSCVRNETKFILIINRLLKIDQTILRLPISPIKNIYSINWHNIYLLIMFCYITALTFASFRCEYLSVIYFICAILYQWANIVSCTFIIFISSLLHLLAVRFRYINQFLSQYQRKMLQSHEIPSKIVKSLNGYGQMGATYIEENLRMFVKNSKLVYGLHSDLLDLLKLINDYSELCLLVYMLYTCYGLLACTYICSMYNWQFDDNLYAFLWMASCIPFFMAINLLLASSCGKATKEANRTSQVLARVYGKGADFQTIVDKFLTKSVKQDVQFTACGFFVIDNTTLFKIFSAVTTCLVILIQFKQLEESNTLQADKSELKQ